MRKHLIYALWFPALGLLGCGGSASGGSATPAETSCDPTKPFGAAVEVSGTRTLLEAGGEWRGGVSLSNDELTLYYSSRHTIYASSRASRTAPFSAGTPVPGVPTGSYDPMISRDGLTLYFAKEGTNSAPDYLGDSISAVSRANTAAPFSSANTDNLVLGLPKDPTSRSHPTLTADGKILYFQDYQSVRRASRSTSGWTVDEKAVVKGSAPSISPDGTQLFFASDRIWMIHDAAGSFDPQTAAEVPGTSLIGAAPQWLSSDGCRMYYTVPSSDPAAPEPQRHAAIFMIERGSKL